jgi:hypothetical protein
MGEVWEAAFGKTIPGNGPPKQLHLSYALPHKNALFIGLDTYAGIDQKWLNGLLATNRLPHVFAFGHQPAFKVGHSEFMCGSNVGARDAFWNSLKKAGARVSSSAMTISSTTPA